MSNTDRSLIMSGWEVHALKAGATQFRRVVKPQPDESKVNVRNIPAGYLRCPYGVPGGRLVVKETLWVRRDDPTEFCYVATDDVSYDGDVEWKKKPSIHMPRWASRYTLDVEQVRVQRLQNVTEEDAMAMRVEREFRTVIPVDGKPIGCTKAYSMTVSYRAGFANTWSHADATCGCGWDANPWSWAVTHKGITGGNNE